MTAGSPARPPLRDPTGGVAAERCRGGAGASRVRILVLYSPIACAAHPDIRGHAPPPAGPRRRYLPRHASRCGAGSIYQDTRRLTGRGDPMRASIRGSDIQCQ